MIAPIYILSKGRADSCNTAKLLDHAGVPYTVVVEPQETADYADVIDPEKLLSLPDNNQGIAYVRNFILKQNRGRWFWMLDDDISGFYVRGNKRVDRIDAQTALSESQRIIQSLKGVVQGGLEYQQLAWSTTKQYALNSYCDVCVLINGGAVGFTKYRDEIALKVDRDFTLQLLSSGKRTARVQIYAFAAPENGSNAGGLQATYQTGIREREAVNQLAAMYPGIVKPVIKKNGRYDAKINWRHFKV